MKERCLARSVEDYEVLLTPEQVESYRESAVVRKSIINFGTFQDGSVFLTPIICCSMRDYLFVEISLTNANRSGVIVNMLLSEYEKAVIEVDGTAVIAVKKHKTSSTHGNSKKCHNRY